MARRQRYNAEAEVAELCDEHGDLVHARDMQDEYVQQAQQESDSIKRQLEAYRMHTKLQMNEESVAHQSKILECNEQVKLFAERKKQFQEEEEQRTLREAQWKQKENNVRLKGLQCIQQFK